MPAIITALLCFAILSAAIMAGIYFTFSVFGVRAFASLGDEAGANAMRAVNRVIVQTMFLPLFVASSLASVALVVLGLMGHGDTGSGAPHLLVAGGLVYALGMSGVTMLGNVPLNNRLEASEPASAEGQALWREYAVRWTRLNHIRTLACLAALVLFVLALPSG